MARRLTIRLIKDKNGGIKEVVWDADGYHGTACEKDLQKLLDHLEEIGIDIKIKQMEKKPEYYEMVEAEETVNEYEPGL